jgi:hypothetical protein
MGHFYFHLRTAGQLIRDEEGQDLPNISAARREAVRSARELLAGAIRSGQTNTLDAFVIADETGRALDTISLASVLREPFRK